MKSPMHKRYFNAVQLSNDGPRRTIRSAFNKSPILALHLSRSPSAIIGFIAKIIFFSINGKIVSISISQRPISENREVIPFSANCDAASAISCVVWQRRIIASAAHGFPDSVKARFRTAMSAQIGPIRFATEAATRKCFPVSQISSARRAQRTAVADGMPQGSAARPIASLFAYKPASEALALKIYKPRVSIFSHA